MGLSPQGFLELIVLERIHQIDVFFFFAKNMCKSTLVCLYIITMNRNGNIVSIRQKSSVDSVQRFLLYFILFTKKEI